MRRSAIALLVLALPVSACGLTQSDGSVVADDVSAVTVAGADSAIEPEGDARPEGETDAAGLVSVAVDVPVGTELAGTAIVALEDASLSDVESVEIARVELPAADLAANGNVVEVFLPLPLDGTLDITATVHIDVDENGSFSQGDWISPELTPVNGGDGAVTVTIVPI